MYFPQAMNGLESAAGAIFVELIRQQAERPNSPADSNISTWMPGYDMGRQYQQHPPAMRVRPSSNQLAMKLPSRCSAQKPGCRRVLLGTCKGLVMLHDRRRAFGVVFAMLRILWIADRPVNEVSHVQDVATCSLWPTQASTRYCLPKTKKLNLK